MNISDFYSDTSPEIWKKIIGEDLHYHIGWGDGDIMYNSISYLYQFIEPKSKILDCGCGWGGPAKVIERDLNCDITAITNSKVQFEYILNNLQKIKVINKDLHEYDPSENFDIALFIESFCHLNNPERVLKNISSKVNKIILREYYLKKNLKENKKYLNKWSMRLYEKEYLIDLFNKNGFVITYYDDHYRYSLETTLNFWIKNLNKIENKYKTNHIKTLEISSKYLYKYINNILDTVELSTFIFEKK